MQMFLIVLKIIFYILIGCISFPNDTCGTFYVVKAANDIPKEIFHYRMQGFHYPEI